MNLRPPSFWSRPGSPMGYLLAPLGWIYGGIVRARLVLVSPTKVSVPVICIGNLTLGGTGKTPTTQALIPTLEEMGYRPHILTRGYGGALKGPVLVNRNQHSPGDVGDEPLLLAQVAPTWVGANRVDSARRAIAEGATILVMDDGLQNPQLYQDVKIAIFDGQRGVGNGCIFPAGPLREFLGSGLGRVDASLVINGQEPPYTHRDVKSFYATLEPKDRPKGKKYIAFAGIGYPEKFFETLKGLGVSLMEEISFPDHHVYDEADLQKLTNRAKINNCKLITTEKDFVKIPKSYQKGIENLGISVRIKNGIEFKNWLTKILTLC